MRTLIRTDPRDERGDNQTRQIVVLCDGTNANVTGGRQDSNVVTLTELFAAHRDPRRIVMYDPGVGNPASLPSAGLWDWLHRQWARIEGLTQGRGVFENILEGYVFLMRHWQPGDEIFVFGFSRGAFTARSLAGLVNRFGIVRTQADPMLTTLLNIYFSRESPEKDASVEQVVRLFTPERARKVRIQYVGVWDTVEAVGVPPFRMRISATRTLEGKRFAHVRQALALDECRRMFRPRVYEQAQRDFETGFGDAGTVEQAWFRGAHADIGGQVPRGESGLGCAPFHWIVSEAVKCGLVLAADGRPLNDEAAVELAVQRLSTRTPSVVGASWGGRVLLHDALHGSALWALSGLAPRDTRRASEIAPVGATQPSIGTAKPAVARPSMFEHPSVERSFAKVPTQWQMRHTVGDHVKRTLPLVLALVLGVLAFIGAGHALMTASGDMKNARDIASWFGPAFGANVAFQGWQLTGPWHAAGQCQYTSELVATTLDLCAARVALRWDLVLIACYAYVGARMVSWAYGRSVGQRRMGEAPSRPWSVLGLALPLAVVSDLAENSMTWLTTSLITGDMKSTSLVAGFVMALASLLKWAGLVGVLVTWIAGLLHRPALPARASQASMRAAPPAAVAAVGLVGEGKAVDLDPTQAEPLPAGQRFVRDADGFEQPAWQTKRDDIVS